MVSSHRKNILWKNTLRWSLIVVAFVTISLWTVIFLSVTQNNIAKDNPIPIPTTVKPIEKKAVASVGMPITLTIPAISVNAKIIYVGLTLDGTMDIPPNQDTVAWYQSGPRPGEIGSAVIAGHYGWINNKGSVFNELKALVVDDEITVTDEKNISTTFIVRESRKYDPDADASAVFESNDGKAHLNLITCDGTWVNSENTYSDRLVIFTDKKEL